MLYTSRNSLKINLSSIFTIHKHPSVFISITITEWCPLRRERRLTKEEQTISSRDFQTMHPQQQTTDRARPTSDQETFCSLVYLIIHNKLLLFELSVIFYQSNKHYPNSLEREVLSFRALLIFEFNRLMHFTSKNSQRIFCSCCYIFP